MGAFNFRLETPRLFLIPLTYEQLHRYVKIDDSLEIELGLLPSARDLSEELIVILYQYVIPTVKNDPTNSLYATLWIIVDKERNVIIGDIGFKGAPGENGVIEIGYGTYPHYSGNGFMTEAVNEIKEWALSRDKVKLILAATDKNNMASQKILAKNNFSPFREIEDMFWWRLKK